MLIEASLNQLTSPNPAGAMSTEALLFLGNWHDSFPRLLVQDPILEPVDKVVWQVVKLAASAQTATSFPSYAEIARLANVSSDATISRAMAILRASRWITLCARARDTRGRYRGNVYALHDEPLTLADTLYLDQDYMGFLFQTASGHSHNRAKMVAQAVLDSLEQDIQQGNDVLDAPDIHTRRLAMSKAISGEPISDPALERASIVRGAWRNALNNSSQRYRGENTDTDGQANGEPAVHINLNDERQQSLALGFAPPATQHTIHQTHQNSAFNELQQPKPDADASNCYQLQNLKLDKSSGNDRLHFLKTVPPTSNFDAGPKFEPPQNLKLVFAPSRGISICSSSDVLASKDFKNKDLEEKTTTTNTSELLVGEENARANGSKIETGSEPRHGNDTGTERKAPSSKPEKPAGDAKELLNTLQFPKLLSQNDRSLMALQLMTVPARERQAVLNELDRKLNAHDLGLERILVSPFAYGASLCRAAKTGELKKTVVVSSLVPAAPIQPVIAEPSILERQRAKGVVGKDIATVTEVKTANRLSDLRMNVLAAQGDLKHWKSLQLRSVVEGKSDASLDEIVATAEVNFGKALAELEAAQKLETVPSGEKGWDCLPGKQ